MIPPKDIPEDRARSRSFSLLLLSGPGDASSNAITFDGADSRFSLAVAGTTLSAKSKKRSRALADWVVLSDGCFLIA
jgi:hypothetical protein